MSHSLAPAAANPIILPEPLARLLEEAGKTVDRDSEAAWLFLDQAAAMLRRSAEPAPQPPAAGGLAPWQIQRVRRHVEENLEHSLPVEELAALVRLSRRHFDRAFSQSFGLSPHAYVTERRIARARHLILTTELSLSEIALECGAADQAHLTRLFRRAVGVSPGRWRREQAGAAAMAGL
ncbi:helix-turn-helix transcriptional regulator [Acetobacteraceae bacterium H6797]|nr:helix-turn-helix transcriptional regulator [Acetobacteraceae bacterium H6797]